jgi:ribosome-binding factor A
VSNRPERVAQRIRRETADILETTLRDPRLSGMISITDVEVTHDLSMARVFVSILEQGEARDRAMEALASAAGFVRRQLAPRLGLREVPELRFLLDTSIERGARVEDILRRLSAGEPVEGDDEEQA